MLRIGFATEFYTLWDVTDREVWGTNEVTGQRYLIGISTDYYYIKNISKDLDKVHELHPDLIVDEELRGQSHSFQVFHRDREPLPADYYLYFPYGKLKGDVISDSFNEWHLLRLFNDEYANKRSRALARRRLVDLGTIIKYNGRWIKTADLQKYELDRFKRSLVGGHHFEDGQRVELRLRFIEATSFHTQFGTTWVETYGSECGRLFKYMGSNTPDISADEYTTVMATIKHDYYKGDMETKLQRIKVVTKSKKAA